MRERESHAVLTFVVYYMGFMADNVLYISGYLLAQLRNTTLLLCVFAAARKGVMAVSSILFLPSDSVTDVKRLVACAVRLLPACLNTPRTHLASKLSLTCWTHSLESKL